MNAARGFIRLSGNATHTEPQDVRDAFPGEWLAPWLRARRKIEGAGYGTALETAFRRAGPTVARIVGPEPAVDIGDFLSAITIKSGTRAGETFCTATPSVATRLGDGPRFRSWMSLMQRFASMAPESTLPVLERIETLLIGLNLSGFEAWLLGGIRLAGADKDKRLAFFRMETPDAERLFDRESGVIGFFDVEKRMRAYLTALWGVRPPIRPAAPDRYDGATRRPSFGDGMIRMPARFPGFQGDQALALYRASLAHIGAHMHYSGPRFRIGKLKPIQTAVVSLIEDARIEALAMRDMPGLKRLWIQFHIAEASGAMTAPSLFARLSRALIDPDFQDIDGWVRKGRDIFHAASDRWEEPGTSRYIGNLLGNDLGQMRVQFNAKTYVPQPAYRDDNAGLWIREDEKPPEDAEAIVVESVRMRQDQSDRPDRERENDNKRSDLQSARARLAEAADEGRPAASYPEYDYQVGRERPDWTTVIEYPLRLGNPHFAAEALDRNAELAARISALVRAARIGRPQRLRRQAEGETLDLDACIELLSALRTGELPDPWVYQIMARRTRDLTVSVLLDVSQSTADAAPSGSTILDLERDAVLLLAEAMHNMGDPFAIGAFSSNGREDVRYTRIKDFAEPPSLQIGAALAGLTSGFSTRLGAALRHTAADLANQPSFRRLILLVTDGEPSDIDCPDKDYLIHDAKRAIQTIAAQGIDVFGISLGSDNSDQLAHVFGSSGFAQIPRIETLPENLTKIFFRLFR